MANASQLKFQCLTAESYWQWASESGSLKLMGEVTKFGIWNESSPGDPHDSGGTPLMFPDYSNNGSSKTTNQDIFL